jgi:predicted enzyme related to lactoylglutathione lyase
MPAQQDLVPEVLQLEVNDWPAMVTFYREVLGFALIFLEPDQQYGWLQAGPLKLALRGGATLGTGHGTRSTLLFRVADVQRTMADLESSGCHFYDQQLAPTGHSYQVAYFSDPEGNALAIFSDPDI